MKVGHHLPNALYAAWHRFDHFQLIPIVDAHVRICSPHQHGIDAAIALFEIVYIAVDRIAPATGS